MARICMEFVQEFLNHFGRKELQRDDSQEENPRDNIQNAV